MQDKTSPRIRKLTQNSSLYSMTKICCKVTAIPETVKSPLMGILARSPHQIWGKGVCHDKGNCIIFAANLTTLKF